MTTTNTEPTAPREVRVPLTAAQLQHVQRLVEHYQQAEAAMRSAVTLLTAGHVVDPFTQFRLEPDALVAVLP